MFASKCIKQKTARTERRNPQLQLEKSTLLSQLCIELVDKK